MKKIMVLLLVMCSYMNSNGQITPDTILQKPLDSTIMQNNSLSVRDTTNLEPTLIKQKVYKLKPAVDIPLTAIGAGWSLFAFTKIYSKEPPTEQKILSLNKENIPAFDRRSADIYHPKADDLGDLLFYGSMPMPVILMLDKRMRNDAFKVAFLYLQSMSVTGLLYTGSVYFNDRFRPYAYNPNVPMARRLRGGAKNSFFAGHVALVGTSTFFMAKMYNDYHPESKVRWLPFTLAGIATATTGLMRYRGGQHFISDIFIGTVVGTLSGILIPHFHKNKDVKDNRLSFSVGHNGSNPEFGFMYKLTR